VLLLLLLTRAASTYLADTITTAFGAYDGQINAALICMR
jgi:hypothetical protein